ncbi:histidine kinase [Streptosporangium lutulentum]
MDELTAQRADTTVAQAAEIRRIERDLHDGAQARLVGLGLSLAIAEKLMETDPDQAKALMREARWRHRVTDRAPRTGPGDQPVGAERARAHRRRSRSRPGQPA